MIEKKIILVGNPNVGKSSLFNAFTSLNEHTGNWTGKTVEQAMGSFEYGEVKYTLVDLPGTYSLFYESEEEKVTRDYIVKGKYDATILVADASSLERSMELLLEVLDVTKEVILVLNLWDEVKKRKLSIDVEKLQEIFQIPVIPFSVKEGLGFARLKDCMRSVCPSSYQVKHSLKIASYLQHRMKKNYLNAFLSLEELAYHPLYSSFISKMDIIASYHREAEDICSKVIDRREEKESRIDFILNCLFANPFSAVFVLFLFLFIILFLTISFSNLPSDMLFQFFSFLEKPLYSFLSFLPSSLVDFLVLGGYRTLYFVISVMMPPMMIFFPLFSLLEEIGFLPRIAFQLDKPFCKCGSSGKQCLTMCMGLGCNAVGVTGARIMETKKMKVLSILTNSLMPCNGRFPMILTMISLFLVKKSGLQGNVLSAVILTLVLCFALIISLLATKFLNHFILKGEEPIFIFELPHFRIPKITKTIILSWKEKAFHILKRAMVVAFPAGLVFYLFTHVYIGDSSLFQASIHFLNPVGHFLGIDGAIILAFLFGFPANEIVLPILFLAYSGGNVLEEIASLEELRMMLIQHGWSLVTVLCFLALSICHFPCATTMLTIKKETQSFFYTLIAFVLPSLIGIVLCFIISMFL